MKNVLLPKAIKLNKDRKQRKWWQRAVRTMAMAVVFCTTYALILPAITMEGEPVCGIEAHTHDEGCYTEKPVTVYVCGLETDLHTHSDACYEQTKSPVCQYVHTHSDSCAAVSKQVLTCTLEESQGHTHSDSCAVTEQTLICTLAESAPHSHTDTCTAPVQVMTCTQQEIAGHTHGEGCYSTKTSLVCTLPEDESHTHGEGCSVTEQVLTCTAAESAGHTHGSECYSVENRTVCTLSTEGHTHGEGCYETKTVPCSTPESQGHTHTESCYETQQFPCDLTVNEGHVHEESCYVTENKLICTIPEEAPHVHLDTCLQETGEMETVLTCELEEHTHEDSCYPLEEEESESQYLCGMGVHTHTEECRDAENNLICTIPEHTHEAACLVEDLDLTADVETAQNWQDMFAELPLTGNWPEDLLAVAATQLGYKESEKNLVLEGETLMAYTRYGAWYGTPYGSWNESFVSFCLHFAGIDTFPTAADSESWVEKLTEAEHYAAPDAYTPKPGDLIFFDLDRTAPAEAEGAEAPAEEPAQEIPVTPDRVGIVVELIEATEEDPARIKTVEGDCDGEVAEVTYDRSDVTIIGYGVLPEQAYVCGLEVHAHAETCYDETGAQICTLEAHDHSEACYEQLQEEIPLVLPMTCTLEEHTHSAQCFGVDAGSEASCGKTEHAHSEECYGPATASFPYEDEYITMTVNVSSAKGLPEGLTMEVLLLKPEDQEYITYEDYAQANAGGELFDLTGYRIRFCYAGKEIELSDAEVTADLTVKDVSVPELQPVSAVAMFSLFGDEEPEPTQETEEESPENQLHLTTLTNDGSGVSESSDYIPEPDSTEPAVMTFSLGSARSFALTRSVEPLPTFTVEYYTYILRYIDNPGYPTLNIINTASTDSSVPVEGEARGGVMPQNGKTPAVYKLYLDDSSQSGYYRVAMDYELLKVYDTNQNVIYSNSMTSEQMDVMRENDHYGIIQVWAKNPGDSDWTKYDINADYIAGDQNYQWKSVDSLFYFTNNPAAAKDEQNRDPIIISEGTELRYVYKPTSSTFSVNSAMFDYDISNGTSDTDSKFTLSTGKKGINTESNFTNGNGYGKDKAKLAFGNSNTGSGWQNQKNGSYPINRYNSSSYQGLSFRLVTGYNPTTHKLTYRSNVTAPYLFTYQPNGAVKGKTAYTDTFMNFNRIGDTYTLTSVTSTESGIHDENLELFEVTYRSSSKTLYSNSFWPFDDINNGGTHDRHFGAQYGQNTQKYSGIAVGDYSATGELPGSDEGDEVRNSYFGLEYHIDFELDGSYTGPLEYLFYGDDDMWVFLTDHTTKETHLIADIGGVHSSVGSYTDLWDWVPHTEERPNGKGKYSMHFFYTERGASGSSCYMQFTIPDATVAPVSEQQVGAVTVSKDIMGEMTSQENFLYNYTVTYPSGQDAVRDRILPYTIYHADKTTTTGALFREGQFTLKDGEKIIIGNIPVGSEFSISEASGENYEIEWTKVPDGATVSNGTVTGEIESSGQNLEFGCTNTYNSLTLHKQVEVTSGETSDEEFAFDVTFTDANGDALTGEINTVTHLADGTYSDPTSHTLQDGKLSVKLKAWESISFYPLPDNTGYTVQETDSQDLLPYWSVSEGEELQSDTVQGTVPVGNVEETCINKVYYVLPNTGGSGVSRYYTFGGLLLMAAACVYYVNQIGRKRQKGGAG